MNQSQLNVSFDTRFDKTTSLSRTPSKVNSEIETPSGPVSRSTHYDSRSSSIMATTPSPFPNAGPSPFEPKWPKDWRAYRCLFGGFLLMFNSWGLVNAYGTFASYYTQNVLQGQDILLLNLIGATECFLVLIFSGVVGRFLDAGYSRYLICTGTVLTGLSFFMLSIVDIRNDSQDRMFGLIWLTQAFTAGLGMACFFVTSSQVAATWFKAKKSLAIGVVASGASIAGLVYPYMFRQLLAEHGFNLSVRYVAIVITGTSALAIYCAQPNPQHKKNPPANRGDWFKISFYVDAKAFSEPAYAFFVAAICFMFFGFYPIFFNLEEWAVSEGFGFRALANVGANAGLPSRPAADQIHTYWLLAIMNGSSTLGRIGAAYLCDKVGALNVHATVMMVSSLLVLILWSLTHTLQSAIAFVVCFGIFSGAVIGLPPASVAYILGPDAERQKRLGQWTGMMYCCSAVFALAGPIIAGHLISHYNTFLTVQLWSGACLFLSAACIFAAIYCREKKARSKRRDQSRLPSVSTSETDLEKDKESEEV